MTQYLCILLGVLGSLFPETLLYLLVVTQLSLQPHYRSFQFFYFGLIPQQLAFEALNFLCLGLQLVSDLALRMHVPYFFDWVITEPFLPEEALERLLRPTSHVR